MKKIIILLLVVFLITGCDVRTNITINKDLSVREEVRMTGTSNFFANYYKDLPITIVNDMLNTGNRKEMLTNNGYKYEINQDERYPAVIAVKNYASVDDFTEHTIFKNQYFTNFETITKENLITIKANGFKKYDQDPEYYEIEKSSINIKVPYVVTENNADSYNASTNTYTWNIDLETKDKEINLTFDKNKIYVYNLVMYISILVLIIIGIITGVIIRKLVIKSKKNNKIYD